MTRVSDSRNFYAVFVHLIKTARHHGELTIWGNVVFWAKDTGFGVRFSAFSQGGARDKLAAIIDEEGRRP